MIYCIRKLREVRSTVYEIITHSATETEEAGKSLAEKTIPGTVIAMRGDLGAGKTAFVRGFASALGVSERVTSPTFTIVNEYDGKIPIFHFDMYRLSGSDELFEIGWEDYIARNGVCIVEWSENTDDIFDSSTVIVSIEKLSDYDRKITVHIPEEK